MHDTPTLKIILNMIRDNYLIAENSAFNPASAQRTSEMIEKAYPDTKLSPNFIHDVAKLLHGQVPFETLFKELTVSGKQSFQRVSAYGLDLPKYAQLLALTKLAAFFERQGDAQMNAYKLAVLFQDVDTSLNYIAAVNEKTKSEHPFHDACLFDMPEDDNWDLNAWRKIVTKNMQEPDFRRSAVVAYASRIQQQLLSEQEACLTQPETSPEVKALKVELENLTRQMNTVSDELRAANREAGECVKNKQGIPAELTALIQRKREGQAALKKQMNLIQTRIKTEEEKIPPLLENIDSKYLLEISRAIVYKNAKQDELAANLFLKYGVPEAFFEEYLKLKPKIKNSDAAIPPIIIDGEKYGCSDCFIIKIKADPKSAMLGNITGCCQSLGKQGQGCAIHGLTSDQGGFYILCKGKPPKDGNTLKILPKDIIAQSWAWRAQDDSLVLDSIESQPNMRDTPEYKEKIIKMYNALAFELVVTKHIPSVKVGIGGATPENMGSPTEKPAKPRDYSGYRDSDEQHEVANINCPLLALFAIDIDKAITQFNALSPVERAEYDEDMILEILISRATPAQFARYLQTIDESAINDYLIEKNILMKCIEKGKAELASYCLEMGGELYNQNRIKILNESNKPGLSVVARKMLDVWLKSDPQAYKDPEFVEWATKFGHAEIIKMLSKTEYFEATDVLHKVLSSHAIDPSPDILEKKKEIINMLIISGVDLEYLPKLESYKADLMQYFVKTYVEHCVNNDLDVNQISLGEKSLLGWAVELGLPQTAATLIAKGASIFQDYRTVELAIRSKNTDMIKIILNEWLNQIKEAQADLIDKDGMTLLMYAVQTDETQLILDLLNLGPDLEVQNRFGMTALHFAAQAGKTENVKILLSRGANMEALNNDKQSPLLVVPNWGDTPDEAIRVLLLAGANIYHKDYRGESFFSYNEYLINKYRDRYFRRLDAWEESLIQQGKDVLSEKDADGKTLFKLAVEVNHSTLAKKLLWRWVEVAKNNSDETNNALNEKDASGKTLLMWASQIGDVSLMERLIAEGADINEIDANGRCALHYAAIGLHIEGVRLLAEHGSSLFVVDSREQTPIIAMRYEVNRLYQKMTMDEYQALQKTEGEIRKIIIHAWGKSVRGVREDNSPSIWAPELGLISFFQDPNNPTDPDGKPLSIWAAEFGLIDILQDLIAKQVDMNNQEFYEKDTMDADDNPVPFPSPLNTAAYNKQSEAVDFLLAHGVKPDDKTWDSISTSTPEIVKKFLEYKMPLPREKDLDFINELWQQPQLFHQGIREIRELMFEYTLFTVCRSNDVSSLTTYINKGILNEISTEKRLDLIKEVAHLGHIEVLQALLENVKLRQELKSNKEVYQQLMQGSNAPIKQLVESRLSKEEHVKNPFQSMQAKFSKTGEFRAKLWEDLFNNTHIRSLQADPAARAKMAESLVRLCAFVPDESRKDAAIREITRGDIATTEVVKEIMSKYTLESAPDEKKSEKKRLRPPI